MPQSLSTTIYHYELGAGSDVTAASILADMLDPYGPPANFLLLCDVSCLMDMLEKVHFLSVYMFTISYPKTLGW